MPVRLPVLQDKERRRIVPVPPREATTVDLLMILVRRRPRAGSDSHVGSPPLSFWVMSPALLRFPRRGAGHFPNRRGAFSKGGNQKRCVWSCTVLGTPVVPYLQYTVCGVGDRRLSPVTRCRNANRWVESLYISRNGIHPYYSWSAAQREAGVAFCTLANTTATTTMTTTTKEDKIRWVRKWSCSRPRPR